MVRHQSLVRHKDLVVQILGFQGLQLWARLPDLLRLGKLQADRSGHTDQMALPRKDCRQTVRTVRQMEEMVLVASRRCRIEPLDQRSIPQLGVHRWKEIADMDHLVTVQQRTGAGLRPVQLHKSLL